MHVSYVEETLTKINWNTLINNQLKWKFIHHAFEGFIGYNIRYTCTCTVKKMELHRRKYPGISLFHLTLDTVILEKSNPQVSQIGAKKHVTQVPKYFCRQPIEIEKRRRHGVMHQTMEKVIQANSHPHPSAMKIPHSAASML